MGITELRSFAENRNIIVIDAKLKCGAPSISIWDKGDCAVIIDHKKVKAQAEELVITAHEIGHCETGTFYNEHTLETRSRCEYRADKWAIKKLVTKDELEECFKQGITEIWDLADYFGLTEEFIRKACKLYGFLT